MGKAGAVTRGAGSSGEEGVRLSDREGRLERGPTEKERLNHKIILGRQAAKP